jgi:hypothetical protein
MAALINTLDNYSPLQIGENGHVEYGWSNSIQEQILQFSFQINRTNKYILQQLSNMLHQILSSLKYKIDTGSMVEKEIARGQLSILYKMIGHTRDIINGKGEYTLSYMMVHTWYKFYPELALFALKCFFTLDNKHLHQYGSWKDFKYFCDYCKENGHNIDSQLIKYAISLINEQIKKDYSNLDSNLNDISLAAKWAPREKSSFSWLYEALSTQYFSEILATANTEDRQRKAILKCKTKYRKILSALNRKIDTTQIKQCEKVWQTIDFNNVTSVTLLKQKKAFLNIKKNGEVRYLNDNDRIICAENFNSHIQKAVRGDIEMKGKRIGMGDFTKQAIELLYRGNQNEKDLLNSQWRDNSSQNKALGKMIAMVDVSGSMDGDPMNVAIALGIRIAEKSLLGKRIMTFSSKPTWVNLEQYDNFISQVEVIKKAEWGFNTNFYAALDLILSAIIESKMSPEDVQDLVLVILSDMQMDDGDSSNKQTLYEIMKAKYEMVGIRVNGKPYKPPHILFWNLRSTIGFPTLSTQPNTSMISGYNPLILNSFYNEGLTALEACTPWSILVKSLENERYKIMENKFLSIIL